LRVWYQLVYAGMTYLRGLCRDTYAPARFGELPLLSVPLQTDARSAHLPREAVFGINGFGRTLNSIDFTCFLGTGAGTKQQLNLNQNPRSSIDVTGPSPRWLRHPQTQKQPKNPKHPNPKQPIHLEYAGHLCPKIKIGVVALVLRNLHNAPRVASRLGNGPSGGGGGGGFLPLGGRVTTRLRLALLFVGLL
jgi:hypothetical protein